MSVSLWWGGALSRVGDGLVGLVVVDPLDRDERQAEVTHALEQTVERCLVGDGVR